MLQIPIFWDDLTVEKQKLIVELFGHPEPWINYWTKYPIALVELKPKKKQKEIKNDQL